MCCFAGEMLYLCKSLSYYVIVLERKYDKYQKTGVGVMGVC